MFGPTKVSPGGAGGEPNSEKQTRTFHGEMDRGRESQGLTTVRRNICSNVTVRAKERIAQSKRSRAGSLAIVD